LSHEDFDVEIYQGETEHDSLPTNLYDQKDGEWIIEIDPHAIVATTKIMPREDDEHLFHS